MMGVFVIYNLLVGPTSIFDVIRSTTNLTRMLSTFDLRYEENVSWWWLNWSLVDYEK